MNRRRSSLLMVVSGVIIASRSLAGSGQCDGKPDFCPSFENQCPKVREGAIHFISPLSGETYDGHCRHGLPDGEVSIHFENGKLFASGRYVNGKREGPWKWYDPEGNLTDESLFADGRHIDHFNPRTNERQIWVYENGKLVAREIQKNGTPIRRFTYREGDGATTVVEFEHVNGRWMKKSEKTLPDIDPRSFTCDAC